MCTWLFFCLEHPSFPLLEELLMILKIIKIIVPPFALLWSSVRITLIDIGTLFGNIAPFAVVSDSTCDALKMIFDQNDRIGIFYFSQRTSILTVILFMRVRLPCGSLRLEGRSSSTPLEENQSEIGYIEENKRNNFTLPASSLPRSSTAQCQERLSWSKNSPIGESESIWMNIQLVQLCRMLPKRPPCPHTIQIKVYVLHDWGMGSNWENSPRSGRASVGCRSH